MAKTALITGDRGLLGHKLVDTFLKANFKVIGISRRECTDLPYKHISFDLRDDPTLLLDSIVREHGIPDVVINNAVQGLAKRVENTTDEEFYSLFKLNVLAPLRFFRILATHYKAEGMIKNTLRNRSIISIGSAGMYREIILKDDRPIALYCATKAALAALSVGASKEFLEFGVRVNVIAPTGFSKNPERLEIIAAQSLELASGRKYGEIIN